MFNSIMEVLIESNSFINQPTTDISSSKEDAQKLAKDIRLAYDDISYALGQFDGN
jgi:hypothetical protein